MKRIIHISQSKPNNLPTNGKSSSLGTFCVSIIESKGDTSFSCNNVPTSEEEAKVQA
jgi:hypothetical protein